MIAAAKTARSAGQRLITQQSRRGRRSIASATKPANKSAVGVVQATNMPLNNLMAFTSPPPAPVRRALPKVQQKLSVMAAAPTEDPVLKEEVEGLEDVDMAELERWASMAPTPLKLGDMYQFAASTDTEQRLRNAQFLHRELPIRLAQRAHDLLSLPHGLSSESTPIRQVAKFYIDYIRQFQAFPVPKTPQEEDQFTDLLHSMVLDRTSIPTTIARGLMEWLGDDRRGEMDLGRQQEMEDALVRFFTARVGLRFLGEHHILSSRNVKLANLRDGQTKCPLSTKEKDRGCIQHDCNPVAECEKVAEEVARQTYDCYGICPEIEIVDRQSPKAQAFTYVPHHLHYMLQELLKNSCRASVERYMEQGGNKSAMAKIAPVRVVIVKGAAEVTIKVSDEGGGIPRSTMARIFKFTHSTSRQEYEGDTEFGTVEAGIQHMRGFGLPLARIYARYFGGELTLKSMEGHGVDAYLYLPRLGDACENLPRRVRHSPGGKVSLPRDKRVSKDANAKNGAVRTFSTMVPKEIKLATEARLMEEEMLRNQSTDFEFDQPGWEEAKIRRVLNILASRAL